MFSSWYGGLWPGVLATVLGAATLGQFFNLSLGAQVLASEDTAFDLALFIVVALLITALNARLRRLNTRLAAARAEAERATRAREEILGVVAHDLKSPLTSISMGAQVTSRWLAQSSPTLQPRVQDMLVQIEDSAQRMAGLIDDLLQAAQPNDARERGLRRRPTRLLDLAQTAAAAHQLGTTRHLVRVTATADPVGEWDADRLARVLDNLLSNAIKYSPEGGEIVLELGQDDSPGTRLAVLRVHDPGVGIPAADVERVFERYFRARNVGAIEGTGIGLAGARQIVEQHGGTLAVESREGVGSTFVVCLPLSPDEAKPG